MGASDAETSLWSAPECGFRRDERRPAGRGGGLELVLRLFAFEVEEGWQLSDWFLLERLGGAR